MTTIRSDWSLAVQEALTTSPPTVAEWRDQQSIIDALEPFMGEGRNHTHFSSGGGMDLLSVSESSERGCIEFSPADQVRYLVKPDVLKLVHFPHHVDQDFLFLTLAPLDPTGVYDNFIRETEEVVDIAGDYHPRSVWDGDYRNEYGDLIGRPAEAELVMRWLRGSFLFVGKHSYWNAHPGTYNGEHHQLGADGVATVIQRIIQAERARGLEGTSDGAK